jgi:RNA polymerase sigma-70 factor, ECF subfamily
VLELPDLRTTLSLVTSRPRWNQESDDGELVAACRAGEVDAFEVLVRRHQKAMLNVALRMLGNYEEACEVAQDAFVAAYKGLANFRGEARFTTWLTTITLNQARNRLDHLASRRRHEAFSLDAPPPGREDDPPPEAPSDAPSALQLMEEEALRKRVERCIQALPRDFREVLVLRDLREHSYGEIGAMLKLQEGTVKSRLFRAREGVKDCLQLAPVAP